MNNEEKILEILAVIQADISGLKDGQARLESDVAVLKSDVAVLKDGQAKLETNVEEIMTDLAEMKATQNQHTFQLKKIARIIEAQTNVTVSLEQRVTNIERFVGII